MAWRRVGRGAAIAGVSGLVLLVALFLPWYGVDAPGVDRSADAWQTLKLIDLVLLVVALLAVGWVAALATGALAPNAPAAVAVAAVGLLAVALIVFRIVDLPTPDVPARFAGVLDYDVRLGAFIGLGAAAGVALGGLLALRDNSSSR